MRLILASVLIASVLVVLSDGIFLYPWFLSAIKPHQKVDAWTSHIDELLNTNKPRKHLSPIDIQVQEAKDLRVPPLIFSTNHWDLKNFYILNNTGELADFTQSPPRKSLTLSGGPLPSVYKFDSMHAHWHPQSDMQGTEHSLNRRRFAMEFHAVYYNKLYRSLRAAKGKPDGLTVCSFIVEAVAGMQYNHEFAFLTGAAEKVEEPLSATLLQYNVYLPFKHLALSEKYFHYSGSLTGKTPEPAKWILFKDTIQVHPSQVEPFRNMQDHGGEPISNVRESQAKHNRVVYSIDNTEPNNPHQFWNFII